MDDGVGFSGDLGVKETERITPHNGIEFFSLRSGVDPTCFPQTSQSLAIFDFSW